MKPILKWPGGKSWAIPYVKELITPEALENHVYIEPFVGSGALAFAVKPKTAILGDLNRELINCYTVIRNNPKALIDALKMCQDKHNSDFYLEMRALDRNPDFLTLDTVYRAARFIYLNKTCFNGLYRVNSKGYFNVPMGRTSSGKTPDIVQEESILELSEWLQANRNSVNLICGDYLAFLKLAKAEDVVVLDPPYAQTFTGYQKGGFTWEDTEFFKTKCDELRDKGCKLIIFNENTPEIKELFNGYEIMEISTKRSINRNGSSRKASEVIITNII